MLLSLPHELISLILLAIDTPKTFFRVLQTCKLIYLLSPIKKKRVEFLKRIEKITQKDFEYEDTVKIIWTVLPNGEKEGDYVLYHVKEDSSFIKYESRQYVNGKKEGVLNEYCSSSGGLHSEIYYKDGKISGLSRRWDCKGQLISEETYYRGIPVGTRKEWNYNGNPHEAYYIETTFYKKHRKIIKEFWTVGDKRVKKSEYGIWNSPRSCSQFTRAQ